MKPPTQRKVSCSTTDPTRWHCLGTLPWRPAFRNQRARAKKFVFPAIAKRQPASVGRTEVPEMLRAQLTINL
jgi:hypothetical protein